MWARRSSQTPTCHAAFESAQAAGDHPQSGATEPSKVRRKKVSAILHRSPGLRTRIDAAKRTDGERTEFGIEADRVRSVILKPARGHAAYELSQVCREDPDSIWWLPLALMSAEERDAYDAVHIVETLGEMNSRALQPTMVIQIANPSAELGPI